MIIQSLLEKFGYVRKSDVISQLHYGRSVGKRLDEHREVVQAIEESTHLFSDAFWHVGHMAMQDDYLMRLYKMVHGCWPDDTRPTHYQPTGEYVRPRPAVLGECGLPEYKKV